MAMPIPAEPYRFPLNEEIAGPVTTSPPQSVPTVSRASTCSAVSPCSAFCVLNIDDFGNPSPVHDIPVGTPIDNFSGPHAYLNLALLLIKWMFFEGKMRGLFSMLFGAGVILLTSRAERRGSTNIADIYTRRNLLLLCFGVIHACFIWGGDILFDYGFQALLFLYPARKLKPKTLLWLGTFLSLVVSTIGGFLFFGATHDYSLHRQASAIQAQQRAGVPITAEQKNQLHQWQERVESQRLTPEKIKQSVQEATLPYPASIIDRAQAFQAWLLPLPHQSPLRHSFRHAHRYGPDEDRLLHRRTPIRYLLVDCSTRLRHLSSHLRSRHPQNLCHRFLFPRHGEVDMAPLLPHPRGRFDRHSRHRHPPRQKRLSQNPAAPARRRRQNCLQ